MLRNLRICVVAVALCLGVVASVPGAAFAAGGNAFLQTFTDYKADGQINGCQYTQAQLKDAQSQVPPDIAQYAPDFPGALSAALEQRARGCGKQAAPVAPVQSAPAGPPISRSRTEVTKAPPSPPAPDSVADHVIPRAVVTARDQGASDAPAPILALAIVGGLLGLTGVAWGIERWGAWEPGWLLASRHAIGEAGFRMSATWADFTDWVRLGR